MHAPVARKAQRFFRTPKGLLLVLLSALLVLALPAEGVPALEHALAAALVAAAVDVALAWSLRDEWVFPSGALLTGLIVAMVLGVEESLLVVSATAFLAIVGKHLLRSGLANVFNPAALALVVAAVAFGSPQSWWGALPDLGLAGFVALTAAGVFIADRINKLPLVVAFLAFYFGLFTVASFAGQPSFVAEVFRAPDLQAALFFACFMLDDPPTCPVRYRDQVAFALIVAVVSYVIFMTAGVVYFLLAGLLVGNLFEAARRALERRSRRSIASGTPY